MDEPNDATPYLPERRSLAALREAAAACEGCHLHRHATQTVFGEGRAGSRLMFVGEMAGDREDREGRPFVGPAGRELSLTLEAVGIDRGEAYVTNVVKHFSFAERGRRRIHQTPKRFEIEACRPWLDAELRVVEPEVLVTLGATAAKAPVRELLPGHTAERTAGRLRPRAAGHGHHPSLGHPALAHRRGPPRRA